MKTTAFKIFASCIAIVCLSSSPVTRAAPVLKSGPSTSENPIVEKQSIKDKNLVRLNFVDLESHYSGLISNEVGQKPSKVVHEPMVPKQSHRQLRSYNPKVEEKLRRELEGENSSISVDSKEAVPVLPEPSNEIENSQQSNEIQNSQSNEVQDSQSNEDKDSQSNEVQNSQSNEVQNSQSNEVQNSQSNEDKDSQSNEDKDSQSNEDKDSQSNEDNDSKQSIEDSKNMSDDDAYNFKELPTPYGSSEIYDPNDISDGYVPGDDEEERDTIRPSTLVRTTT